LSDRKDAMTKIVAEKIKNPLALHLAAMTAKALGLTAPSALLAAADELIE
jgi:hypothetical protein